MNLKLNKPLKRRSKYPFVSQILVANYSLSIFSNGWRVDRYFPTAILITSLQVYFIVSAAFIGFYPKLRSMNDAFYFGIKFIIITILILGFLQHPMVRFFKFLNIPYLATKEEARRQPVVTSLILSILIAIVFSFISFSKVYKQLEI